jgi:uncharacterized damage-inducible protein DinB
MTEQLQRLAAHLAWADERVLSALRADPGSDAGALAYFAHILAAAHVWLARIHQRPPDFAVWPALSLDECAALAERNRRELDEVTSTLPPAALGRQISYRNSAGVAFVSRLDDILLHVALHGAYHRGQVSLMVRRSGGTPAPTDYIAFVRGAPAATRRDGTLDAGPGAG